MRKKRAFVRRLIRQITPMVGLMCIIILSQGCSQTGTTIGNLRNKLRFGDDITFLEKGFAAYEDGKTDESAEIFQELYDNSGSLMIRRQALYGLAISGMINAGTPEEYQAAQRLWQDWRKQHTIDPEHEDPVYLEPFLECKFPGEYGEKRETTACSEKVTKYEYDTIRKQNDYLEDRIKALQQKYRELESENESLTQALNRKDSKIRMLEQKIEALEKIDQTIQEKKNKTEISSPE